METLLRIVIALEGIQRELHKFNEPTVIIKDEPVKEQTTIEDNKAKAKRTRWTENETKAVKSMLKEGHKEKEIKEYFSKNTNHSYASVETQISRIKNGVR